MAKIDARATRVLSIKWSSMSFGFVVSFEGGLGHCRCCFSLSFRNEEEKGQRMGVGRPTYSDVSQSCCQSFSLIGTYFPMSQTHSNSASYLLLRTKWLAPFRFSSEWEGSARTEASLKLKRGVFRLSAFYFIIICNLPIQFNQN